MRKSIETIPAETMSALMRYHWPGNVRELQNVIERAVILSIRGVLRVGTADLERRSTAPPKSESGKAPARRRVSVLKREQVVQALKEADGQVGGSDGAAARLGLKRTTLIAHMKKLGINPRTVINHF
jgi:formate hydrogenlyase transcriptional activator